MEQIVIDQGIIFDPEHNLDLTFRCMLNQPIGQAYLYVADGAKTPELMELEMKVLNHGDRNVPVVHASLGVAWPIFWNDEDFPEIPVALMDIFGLIFDKNWVIKEISEGYGKNHVSLISMYAKYSNKIAKNTLNNGENEEI